MTQEIIQLEDGWKIVKLEGIEKLEQHLEVGATDAMTDVGEEDRQATVFQVKEFSMLYTTVYKMCTQKNPFNWSEKLYTRYGEAVSHYVQQRVKPAVTGKTGLVLLSELRRRWENHKVYIKWMEKIFQYLDRYFVNMRSVDPLRKKGLSIFKSLVFDDVSAEATKALLELIDAEREGHVIPEDVVKAVIEMYIWLGNDSLSVYNSQLEDTLLPASAAFYARRAKGWLETVDLPEYLVRTEQALRSEDDRVNRYLSTSSLTKLRGVAIIQLLQEPQSKLLGKPTSIGALLEQDRLEDLARAYRMFGLVENGLGPLAIAFRQFVTTRGNALVDAKEEQMRSMSRNEALADPSFIQSLISLHDKYKGVVGSCFQSDTMFQKSLKEAFEVFVNRDLADKISTSALMSSFCDRLLKRSSERVSDEVVEEFLTKLVDLFSFLTDKDDFAEIYRNQLAKRLIGDLSASDEAEKSLIQKLKMKCGSNFTSKLEGMVTDLALSNDMQRDFISSMDRNVQSTFELSVSVLTTGFWPSYTSIDVELLPEMNTGLAYFREFYSKRTQHRRLQWIHSLGTATVAARFPSDNRRYDLVMNTYQALILDLFNTHAQLSVEQISSLLKLEDAFVKKLLATLILSKFKVLTKPSEEKSIESNDVISVNEAFSVPTRKVKIPPPVAGNEETHNRAKVEEDRSFSIEAAIVRVMKTKKVLQHQQLVAEVVEQLTLFKPNPKAIKQRIENLIEREFLERDPDNPSLYKYLA
jgi:cullin 1